jgi:photosystem II stability/assembly factor-like uncharacterized protein
MSPPPLGRAASRLKRFVVREEPMYRRTLGLSFCAGVAAACGDDGGDTTDAPVAIDAPDIDAPDVDAPPAWHAPDCTMVSGTGAVTFTHDEGATVAPRDTVLTGVKYTFGLVALATPNTLYVAHDNHILRSTDAGCTWSDLGEAPGLVTLVAAGDRAYGFVDNDTPLYRIEGTTITALRAHASGVMGMSADAHDPAHLRLLDATGQIWDSADGGDNWTALNRRAPVDSVYRGSFSPLDLDHVMVGTAVTGAHVTRDAGMTWTQSTGLSTGNANAMNFSLSPADANVVWATGVDLADDSKHAWRSTDGGLTFTSAFDNANRTIVNGMPLFAHPTDPDVLYATFGTYFQGYGTDIYKYDAGTGNVTTTHQPFHDAMAIAFLPGDPSWMYLGITNEQIGGL